MVASRYRAFLLGEDSTEANEYASDAAVAVGECHGTLSEIGLALRMGRRVVTLGSWRIESDQRMGGRACTALALPAKPLNLRYGWRTGRLDRRSRAREKPSGRLW